MKNYPSQRVVARRAVVGLSVCWLLAVVLTMAGRYTPVPRLEALRVGMILGTAVFAVVGVGMALRNLGDRIKKEP